MSPPAPAYQHGEVNSLKWLAVDDKGEISGEKSLQLYFYDSNKNKILFSTANGVPRELITLKDNCTVSNMKVLNDELYILDGNHGFLFTIAIKNKILIN